MNRLKARLPAFDAAMIPTNAGGHVPVAVNDEVHALIRAISRKARFAEMHLSVLNGIDWDQCDDLGRRPAGAADPVRLKVLLSEAYLILEHPSAVIDHAYLRRCLASCSMIPCTLSGYRRSGTYGDDASTPISKRY